MRWKFIALVCALGTLPFTRESQAQYSVPSQASSADESELKIATGRPPVIAKDDPSLPWEVGASLNFLTSAPSLGGEKLAFTDLMLLRLHALVSLGRYDLFMGSDVLPK